MTEEEDKKAQTIKIVKQKLSFIDEMNEKIVTTVRDSNFGKKIPTTIKEVEFSNIVFLIIIINLFYTFAVYSIIDAKSGSKGFIGWVWFITQYIFLIFGVLGSPFDFFIYYFRFANFNAISVISKFVKMLMTSIFIGILMFSGFLINLVPLCVNFFMVFLDFFSLYYLTTFFWRLKSDDYDENGEPLKKDKHENKNEEEHKNKEEV